MKSVRLTLTVTVRAARPSPSSRRCAPSADLRTATATWPAVVRSAAKVLSALICLASARSCTGLSSYPRAIRAIAGPTVLPRAWTTSSSSIAARSPMVAIPNWDSRSPATGPTPHRLRTGSGSKTRAWSRRCTTATPSGLASSEAILAYCLPAPAPTEAGRPVASRIAARRSCAHWRVRSTSAPRSSGGSRKASSTETCSTTGACSANTSNTRRLSAR